MDCILIKCEKCHNNFLTLGETGTITCPMCNHRMNLLVGTDAVDKLLEQTGSPA